MALVAGLAVADALRSRERDAPPPPVAVVTSPARAEPSPELVRRLRAQGISGILVLADSDCRVRAISLPALEQSARPEPWCTLRGPDGQRESPEGSLADCRAGTVRVSVREAELVREVEGCTPAWRPDGAVAFVREGALLELSLSCARDCERTLLSAGDLRQTGVVEPRVVDHVWLSSTRAAVLLAWPGGGYVLGVFEGRRLIASHRWGGEGPGRLEAAPGGGLFTARPARIFRRDGVPITLAPRFRNARAIEWSPDGRWAAVALGAAVVLVPAQGLVSGAETRQAIRLPYAARDVAWRRP